MKINELLNHVYPSCKVILYCENGEELEYMAGDLTYPLPGNEAIADYEFSDWALYTHFIAIFM